MSGEQRAWLDASWYRSRFICCNAIASQMETMLTDPLAIGHWGRERSSSFSEMLMECMSYDNSCVVGHFAVGVDLSPERDTKDQSRTG
jgi:hypothetical protein